MLEFSFFIKRTKRKQAMEVNNLKCLVDALLKLKASV